MIWNREAETMSRGARERLQLERLQEVVRWAVARVAFHRDRLGTARLQGSQTSPPFRSSGRRICASSRVRPCG